MGRIVGILHYVRMPERETEITLSASINVILKRIEPCKIHRKEDRQTEVH